MLLIGAVIRAAGDFVGGMLIGAILAVIVPTILRYAFAGPVSKTDNVVVMFLDVLEYWPLAIVIGLATTFILRSVVEGSAG